MKRKLKGKKRKMSHLKALKILEETIQSWTSINDRFPEEINAHSLCLGETQIEAMMICAERLKRFNNEKTNGISGKDKKRSGET